MFKTAFKTVIRQKTDHEELNGYLHTLGERHIMRGIHKMHMERGYEAFFKAIKVGCPDIIQQELIELTGSVRSSVEATVSRFSIVNILTMESGPGTGRRTGSAPVSMVWVAWATFSRHCARPGTKAWRRRRWGNGPGF
ncbi:MAG: globin [Rhodospirillaceae bacterium]|nr:globin [Rhodospirillaceae bacterium]